MAKVLSENTIGESNKPNGLGELYNTHPLSITLSYPNDTVVAQGTKSTIVDQINWDSLNN